MAEELNLVGDVVARLGIVVNDIHQQFGAGARQADNKDGLGERWFHLLEEAVEPKSPALFKGRRTNLRAQYVLQWVFPSTAFVKRLSKSLINSAFSCLQV